MSAIPQPRLAGSLQNLAKTNNIIVDNGNKENLPTIQKQLPSTYHQPPSQPPPPLVTTPTTVVAPTTQTQQPTSNKFTPGNIFKNFFK